jgi:RNA polymerase sigma-70 factor (sigma-E family)
VDVDADSELEALVAGFGDRLMRLAYQLTHERALAEDVVQEALVSIFRNWRRRSGPVAEPFAYGRRAVVNEYLRRRRLAAATEIVTDELPEVPAPSFDSAVADRDEVWRALGALPARQRAVLVLRYYEDLPDVTIAELLDAKEATVRSWAMRGLAALRTGELAHDGSPS